jgi:hypothetical protein
MTMRKMMMRGYSDQMFETESFGFKGIG